MIETRLLCEQYALTSFSSSIPYLTGDELEYVSDQSWLSGSGIISRKVEQKMVFLWRGNRSCEFLVVGELHFLNIDSDIVVIGDFKVSVALVGSQE